MLPSGIGCVLPWTDYFPTWQVPMKKIFTTLHQVGKPFGCHGNRTQISHHKQMLNAKHRGLKGTIAQQTGWIKRIKPYQLISKQPMQAAPGICKWFRFPSKNCHGPKLITFSLQTYATSESKQLTYFLAKIHKRSVSALYRKTPRGIYIVWKMSL